MAKGRQIVVEFLGEDKSLSSTAKKVEGTTGKLGGRLGKVGLIAGGALATGIGAASVAMVGMVKNAAEDEAGQRRLAVALKNATGATKSQVSGVEEWISAQGTALGVTDDELRPAFQKLVQATGDVGKAQKLSAIAMDASAGSGKSLETVSAAIAKAHNGNLGALSRLGVKIKDTDGKTLSFNDAMKEMSKTFGGQAAAKASSFRGKMDRLKLVFDETKEAIGARLIPIATKLAGWFLDKGLPAMTKFGKYLGAKLGPIFAKVGGFLKKFGTDGEGTSKKFGKTIATLKGIFTSLSSIVKSVVSIITSLWKRFGDTITKYAEGSFKNIVTIIGGALKVIAGVFKVFASLLKGDWKGVWDGLKMIVSGAWSVIKGLVSQSLNVIKTLFSVAGSALKGIFGGLWNGLKAIVVGFVSWYIGQVKSTWNTVKSAFSSAGSAIKKTFASLWDGIQDKASKALSFFKAMPGKMKSALSGMFDGLKTAFRTAINFVIDKWNGLSFGVPGFTAFGKKFGGFSVNTPNIRRLYQGGIVPASKYGMPALLGDRGHAEAVIPLSGPHAPNIGGSGDISLTVYLDSEVVHRSLVRRKRTLGRELGLA